jgi:hypothetical protein
MRKFILAAALSLLSFGACAGGEAPQVHKIALSFVDFWDANKDKPAPEQLAAFRKDVAPGFPAFYGIERYGGRATQADNDARIEKAIQQFPAIREAYLRQARQFDADLPRYLASFKAAFPDYQLTSDIYVLHSLGEMDGGTRTLNGKDYLIFGIDGMVRYHTAGSDPSAFFHHELFHTYHEKVMEACDGDVAPVWAGLWMEGLAVYVSKVLNPKANDEELELDFPRGSAEPTRQAARAGMMQLETVLESSDPKVVGALFSTGKDDTGLPSRRGYYLGYLVAQEAGKRHSLQELATLDCKRAHALVTATVHALNAAP